MRPRNFGKALTYSPNMFLERIGTRFHVVHVGEPKEGTQKSAPKKYADLTPRRASESGILRVR